MRLSGNPEPRAEAAPLLGEHTSEILGEVLGYPEARVTELRAQGIV
jgi:crotonobetainyl-CoA:carnitine CoA-transferase CaiB-like acyl-CoA transferase